MAHNSIKGNNKHNLIRIEDQLFLPMSYEVMQKMCQVEEKLMKPLEQEYIIVVHQYGFFNGQCQYLESRPVYSQHTVQMSQFLHLTKCNSFKNALGIFGLFKEMRSGSP